MPRLFITPHLAIDDSEIVETFLPSRGPGGQNVNKVSTAVQLRFDVRRSSLPGDVRARLLRLAGHRATKEGVIVLTGQQYRLQQRNRQDVRERLIAMISKATIAPNKRKPTNPTKASRERRLEGKKIQSQRKKMRAKQMED